MPLETSARKSTSKKTVRFQSTAPVNAVILSEFAISQTPEERKRSMFPERNRTAAVKCRIKKKVWTTELERRARDLQASNYQHTIAICALKSEMAFLRTEVLKHARCGPDRVETSPTRNDHNISNTSVEQDSWSIGTDCISDRTTQFLSGIVVRKQIDNEDEASKGTPDLRVELSIDDEQIQFIESPSENKLEALLMDQLEQDTNRS